MLEHDTSAKFDAFSPVDGKGEARDDVTVAATLNHDAIRKAGSATGSTRPWRRRRAWPPGGICDNYHRLWRTEESSKVMKSKLDVRPSAFRGETLPPSTSSSVFLARLLQTRLLEDRSARRA